MKYSRPLACALTLAAASAFAAASSTAKAPAPFSLIHDVQLHVSDDPSRPVCWDELEGKGTLRFKGAPFKKEGGRIDWQKLDLERFRGMEVDVVFEYRTEDLEFRPNQWAPEREEDFLPLTWSWRHNLSTYESWVRPVIPKPDKGTTDGWVTWRGRTVIYPDDDLSNAGARLTATFGEGTMYVRDYRFEPAKEPFMDGIVRKAGATIPEGYRCEYSPQWLEGGKRRGIVAMWTFKPEDFEKIADWGCNLVRMSRFNPLTDDYERLEANLAVLKKRGVRVIFAPMTPGYGGNMEKGSIFNEPDKREEYLKGWAKLAEYFKGRDDVWAFGLMNEPFQGLFGNDTDQFNFWQLQYEAIKTIRGIDPDRPIVASADGPGAPASYSLAEMRPFPFKDVWYELHFYAPVNFTHSDVVGSGLDFSNPENAYPGLTIGGLTFDRKMLADGFAQANPFAEKWGARWFLGEFSAARHAVGAAQWLDDVASIADSFPNLDMWTYHSYGEYHAWNLEYDETSPFNQAKRVPEGAESARLKVMKRHWAANAATPAAATGSAASPAPAEDDDDYDSPWGDEDDGEVGADAARVAREAMEAARDELLRKK